MLFSTIFSFNGLVCLMEINNVIYWLSAAARIQFEALVFPYNAARGPLSTHVPPGHVPTLLCTPSIALHAVTIIHLALLSLLWPGHLSVYIHTPTNLHSFFLCYWSNVFHYKNVFFICYCYCCLLLLFGTCSPLFHDHFRVIQILSVESKFDFCSLLVSLSCTFGDLFRRYTHFTLGETIC